MIDARVNGARALAPSPTASPMHGFVARVAPGARYAIYPAGRYTRACLEDFNPELLNLDGRRFLGLIDDHATPSGDVRVAKLADAARDWKLDSILILRDTPDRRLFRNIRVAQESGALRHVEIITQPFPTLSAMLAHLDTYHPTCPYEPAFVRACRVADEPLDAPEPTLLVTLDAEAFPGADRDALTLYGRVVRELAAMFADAGFGFTFCVQVNDSPGGMQATPRSALDAVLEILGPGAIGLRGLDHSMPVGGYADEWFAGGLDAVERMTGVRPVYWAPPGWTLSWRSLARVAHAGIRSVRGPWTGPNCRQSGVTTTLRHPLRLSSATLTPYAYADWMFADLDGNRLGDDSVTRMHESLVRFAAEAPCVIELVAQPYRLVGTDWSRRLMIVRRTLQRYKAGGVRLAGVDALKSMRPLREATLAGHR
ncbi:MAG: hypothetical protein IT450_09895 [Phycisphaerales bacterium]|nr:hypothetical protein [Phycisphaerales bacterium]